MAQAFRPMLWLAAVFFMIGFVGYLGLGPRPADGLPTAALIDLAAEPLAPARPV